MPNKCKKDLFFFTSILFMSVALSAFLSVSRFCISKTWTS